MPSPIPGYVQLLSEFTKSLVSIIIILIIFIFFLLLFSFHLNSPKVAKIYAKGRGEGNSQNWALDNINNYNTGDGFFRFRSSGCLSAVNFSYFLFLLMGCCMLNFFFLGGGVWVFYYSFIIFIIINFFLFAIYRFTPAATFITD